ncbi:hypothetical protein AKJ51_01115 [candidate division MSBL1 archaeon SCGC-AAA382A20]|uniref:Uroporphyrinogen decarboxylase (URO-D) domain-containing protein n=1 Tax=candidate division MSBL1 archaeon SCGC-AAA382A20 TaxID=1698280 RepID=A0A133VM49_9EURY|nr:hypothetical protein AKJ51_01115 [candidate division MSBL1 archaeon SCGC-AAA382A20]
MDIDYKQHVLEALEGNEDFPAVTSVTTTKIIDMMEEVNARTPEVETDPETHARLAVSLHEIVGFDSVHPIHDITMNSEVLGCEISEPVADDRFNIETHPETPESILELEVPENFAEKGRFPLFKEYYDATYEKVGGEVAILGIVEGPTTAAGNLLGEEEFMKLFISKPDLTEDILDITTEAVIKGAKALKDFGYDSVEVADPTAAPPMVKPDDFHEKIQPHLKEIGNSLGNHDLLHICGPTDPIVEYMDECNFPALSVEEENTIEKTVEIADSAVCGNVSTTTTLFNGTSKEAYDEAVKALEAGVDIVAPACGIPEDCPKENLIAMVEAWEDFVSKEYSL